MSQNKGASTGFQRWRHTRGYGVHSPFGYQLVTRAIRPGHVAYYGYADIDHALSGPHIGRLRREARMLLRLAAMLNPESIFLQNGAHPAYQAAVRALGTRTRIIRTPKRAIDCDLICSLGDFIPLDTLKQALALSGHGVALRDAPEGWADRLFEALPQGVMFTGPRNVLVINRDGMQKINYPVSIG